MARIPQECTTRDVVICPSEIHFLRFIVEAYEGMGVVTTLCPQSGLVRLSIAPGCEAEIGRIVDAEKTRLQLRSLILDPVI